MKTEYLPQLAAEAVIVGVLFVVFYMVISVVAQQMRLKISDNAKLFLAGVLGHLVLEFTGVNKYYCKHSYAVKSCSCGCNASKEARGEIKKSCSSK